MNKKILILGGSYAQLPFIKEAKARNYYIILIDYLENNPGQDFADEYYSLSTTDKNAVLKLAIKIKPDIIYSYASDPAAPTVAYIANKLGLKYANDPTSVDILGEKNKFKEFLRLKNFNVPNFITINLDSDNIEKLEVLDLPFIIKPTDSSGSKGVNLITSYEEIKEAVKHAQSFSRNNILIAEEYIDTNWQQIHGDMFIENGEIIFSHLGDHHFDINQNSFVPFSTSWPSKYSNKLIEKVNSEVQKVLNLLEYKNGPINVEARIKNEKVYIMELGPRNGGNFVPIISKISTEFDMIEGLFNQFEGITNTVPSTTIKPSCYYVLRSFKPGLLKKINISKELDAKIEKSYIYKKVGEQINSFTGANEAIGVFLMTFDNIKEMNNFYEKDSDLISIELD